MEPEGSLPNSQQPATCPYPKPDQSSPRLLLHRFTDPFYNSLITYPLSYKTQSPRIRCTKSHVLLNSSDHTKMTSPGPRERQSQFLQWGVVNITPYPPSWMTTPFRLFATAYSIYSQLSCISGHWRTEEGFRGVQPPPPPNSEGPPKSCQTQPDCENC